jgi:hypothetical protein
MWDHLKFHKVKAHLDDPISLKIMSKLIDENY